MRLLLDTHVLWWTRFDGDRVREDAAAAIADGENDVYVSAISLYEIALKANLGKLEIPDGVFARLAVDPYAPLDVRPRHARDAGRLPLHHRDPFDRILVAQAQLEGLTVVTRDPAFRLYDVRTLAA